MSTRILIAEDQVIMREVDHIDELTAIINTCINK